MSKWEVSKWEVSYKKYLVDGIESWNGSFFNSFQHEIYPFHSHLINGFENILTNHSIQYRAHDNTLFIPTEQKRKQTEHIKHNSKIDNICANRFGIVVMFKVLLKLK